MKKLNLPSFDVINDDKFIQMSIEARLIYYEFFMRVNKNMEIKNPYAICRMCGIDNKYFNELRENNYLMHHVDGKIVMKT